MSETTAAMCMYAMFGMFFPYVKCCGKVTGKTIVCGYNFCLEEIKRNKLQRVKSVCLRDSVVGSKLIVEGACAL
ncbi:hypothetical protein L9F63_024806, partial [Diploptera punctata]